MFKIKNYLNRNSIYFLISILMAIAIIVTDIHPLGAKIDPNQQSIPEIPKEIVDLEQFSDIITKLESKWETDYERYFNRDFSNQSRSAKQIANRLRQVKKQTNINPAVIWAIPKDDFLELILVTPEKQFIIKKIRGGNKTRLSKRINQLERGVADPRNLNYFPPARIIYQWLIKPLESSLAAENIDTLLLCTGKQLRSLPFSALHDGEQFLVEKYNLARIPAFNLTDTRYQERSSREILAMGTSEFEELPPLPGVEVELNTIVPKLWSGQKIVDQDFTIANLIKAHQQGNFDIVHIASHSLFTAGNPENSYIQFSDRKLTLDQIANLKLDLPQVDLLVLSACQTAIGNEDAEYGFAGLAMQAGVKSALASLWSIDDAGTVVLMSEFYQQLKSNPIKSAALRQAQINLLQKKVFLEGNSIKGVGVEVDLPPTTATETPRDFSHPFYWAGFTIIGNPW